MSVPRFLGSAILALTLVFIPRAATSQSREPTTREPIDGPRRELYWIGLGEAEDRVDPQSLPIETAARPAAALFAIGVLSAGVSLFAGAYAGAGIEERWYPCSCDDPGLEGALLGAMILPALTTPLVVHAMDRGVGSLGSDLGASILAGLGGFGIGLLTQNLGVMLIAPAIAEVIASVGVELATSHR